MKINNKLVFVILEITLIPLFLTIFVAYSNAKDQLETQIISKLQAVADVQKSRFENTNRENLEKLKLLTHDPDTLRLTDSYIKSPNSKQLATIQNKLNNYTNLIPGFKEISIANPDGIIVVSTNPASIGHDVSDFDFFQKGKTTNNVTEFLKDQNGALTLNLSGPLISKDTTIGVLIIVSDGSSITSITSNYIGLGATGETLLVTKDKNGDALFLTPSRFDPGAPLSRIVTKDNVNIPSVHAANGEEIVMLDSVDYLGTPIIAVTRYIPESSWGIVAKISQDEAYSPIKSTGSLLLFIGILSLTITLFISYSVAKTFSSPITKLTEFARKVGLGDLTQRISINTKDEIGVLSLVFNETVSKLQLSYQDLEKKIAERTSQLLVNLKELDESRKATLSTLEDVNHEKVKFEALLTNIGEGVIATDEQTNIIVVNPAAERILGLNKNEIYGKSLTTVVPVVDKDGNVIPVNKRPINAAISTMKPFSTSINDDYYYQRKDGVKIPVSLNASPVVINGRISGIINVFRDISHEKNVDRMKTEFVSLSSHQLRTPLTAIKWGIEAFMEDVGNLSLKQKEDLKDINNSTLRMIELVNSLLNISRIESGRIEVIPQPINIVKLANDVVSKLKLEMTKKGISIVMNVTDILPTINLDEKLIYNVYQNLVSNAISYSPEGSKIVLSIFSKNGEAVSSVQDAGIGIPEGEKPHIFDKFYRASNARQVRPDGSGLGLYIVKSIVESSGGKIWFESTVGKGTTFYFSIPLTGMKEKRGEVSLT